MLPPVSYKSATIFHSLSSALMSLLLLTTPAAVLAKGGKAENPQGRPEASQPDDAIQVDAETAKRLGIKVEPVTRQQLAVGIKTTGQIETLPNQKVDVTAPIDGTVVELLVNPGAFVTKGQTVAVLSSPELAQLRVDSVQKRAEAEPGAQQALADLRLAQQNYERQRLMVAADLKQAQTQMAYAQEKYDRDRELAAAGALARRPLLESNTQLAQAKAALIKTASRLPVLEALAQLKRAQAAVEVAQSKVRLSSAAYQARLQQLGISANAKGLVTVATPISGIVADRQITLGETISLQAASKPLMTILNDNRVWATANIYEKDLDKVERTQQVRVRAASLPNCTFEGKITFIGAVVEGGTRAVPVKAELDNSHRLLKPGMFADLEILTDRTPKAILAIPRTAVVEANAKKIVYVQNGNAYRPVQVTLGRTSSNLVELKSGLIGAERVVTEGATLLYAQSLGGSSMSTGDDDKKAAQGNVSSNGKSQLHWWLVLPIGAAMAGTFWVGRRSRPRMVLLRDPEYEGAADKLEDYPHTPGSRVKSHSDSQQPDQD